MKRYIDESFVLRKNHDIYRIDVKNNNHQILSNNLNLAKSNKEEFVNTEECQKFNVITDSSKISNLNQINKKSKLVW